jgi:hypothetical protein
VRLVFWFIDEAFWLKLHITEEEKSSLRLVI